MCPGHTVYMRNIIIIRLYITIAYTQNTKTALDIYKIVNSVIFDLEVSRTQGIYEKYYYYIIIYYYRLYLKHKNRSAEYL